MSDDETTTPGGPVSDGPERTDDDAEATAAAAHRRRTVIRLLVGLGVGIPVLVELATLVGLVEQSLFGGDEADTGSDPTATEASADRVDVGDELLPATPQSETLSAASFRTGSDAWVLTLVASVDNTESAPYVVQFGPVTTEAGRRVDGTSSAVTVSPGETAQVTGTWQLRPGSRPAAVVLRTAVGDAATRTTEVPLGDIAVQGQ